LLASSESIPADPHAIPLDPFAFLAGSASRIVGLGGREPASDAAYAFHTPYGNLKTGQTRFVLRFGGLRASVGNLTLLINAMSPLAGSVARTVKLNAYALRDIAMTGELSATVSTKGHLYYAVLGFVYGPTNASAETLEIEAYQSDGGIAEASPEHEVVYTEFGDVKLRQMSLLASSVPATLANPVSQTPTSAQYLEPAFAHWVSRLGPPQTVAEETWARAYVLSALDCYGMMADGASGFGVCDDGQSMHAALLASGGASILFPADAAEPILGDLSNHDFSWSIDAACPPAENITSRIDMMLEPLKIGGISVHVMPYDSQHRGGNWHGRGDLLTRSDLDRLILQLLTAGHDVAQLKIGSSYDGFFSRVGLIIRKGRSTFY